VDSDPSASAPLGAPVAMAVRSTPPAPMTTVGSSAGSGGTLLTALYADFTTSLCPPPFWLINTMTLPTHELWRS
jgi:hypothetical protein